MPKYSLHSRRELKWAYPIILGMHPLFDITNLSNYEREEELPFKCQYCFETFYMKTKWVRLRMQQLSIDKRGDIKYCSINCAGLSHKISISINCAQCEKIFIKNPSQIKKSKSGNNFCSRSCAATYNNCHKTTGYRRSKLEFWLEEQLNENFSQLKILYNDKITINSELDIYIPSLNIAFELNGIFHYEPIYGEDKLLLIKNNDTRKFQACLEHNIELVIIDSSSLKKFIPKNAEKYWEIIKIIIEGKLT